MGIGRVAALLDGDEPGSRLEKIRAFEIAFAIILAAEYWVRGIPKWDLVVWQYTASVFVITALVVPAMSMRWHRFAFAAMAAAHIYIVWREFPASSNHSYLEAVICLLAAFLDPRDEDQQALFLRSMRWIVVLVLLYSGVQKVAHGYWVEGHYLAHALSTGKTVPMLEPLLGTIEFARLSALSGEVGDGPYAVTAPSLLFVSNAVWICEIGLAILLLVPRTRTVAMLGTIVLIVAIEAVARELCFGLVFLNALLLFARPSPGPLRVPLFASAAALLVAVRLARPDVFFN